MSCSAGCLRPTSTQAHCGACHRTFRSVGGFDRHRRHGECLDPAGFGFVERARIWRRPLEPQELARRGALRAAP